MIKFLAVLFALGVTIAFAPSSSMAAAGEPGIETADGHGAVVVVDRRKPRVPGGSGCDDPEDIIEHPECR